MKFTTMQLSKQEYQAWDTVKKSGLEVFRVKDLCLLLGLTKTKAYNVIKALKNKAVIAAAGKQFFALRETDDFVIGQRIHFPSYLSFWSALTYYGLSDQTPQKIFYATTKYTREIPPFMYVTLSRKRFFGYTKIDALVIAEREKALIDSLLLPRYAGGIKEVEKALNTGAQKINFVKLKKYALQVKSKVVIRRLGFLLEQLGYQQEAQSLQKNIGKKGYEVLDPTMKRRNNLNKRWLLDVNG